MIQFCNEGGWMSLPFVWQLTEGTLVDENSGFSFHSVSNGFHLPKGSSSLCSGKECIHGIKKIVSKARNNFSRHTVVIISYTYIILLGFHSWHSIEGIKYRKEKNFYF